MDNWNVANKVRDKINPKVAKIYKGHIKKEEKSEAVCVNLQKESHCIIAFFYDQKIFKNKLKISNVYMHFDFDDSFMQVLQ